MIRLYWSCRLNYPQCRFAFTRTHTSRGNVHDGVVLRKYWRRPDIEHTYHHRRQIITTSEISKCTYGKCAPREPYNTMIKHDRPGCPVRSTLDRHSRFVGIASKYINITTFVNINFFVSAAAWCAAWRFWRGVLHRERGIRNSPTQRDATIDPQSLRAGCWLFEMEKCNLYFCLEKGKMSERTFAYLNF